MFYGYIYSTGVIASVLQLSHYILSPPTPQMFHTTSTKIFSGLRSVACWPAQPPYNHHALQTVKQYNIQPGLRDEVIKRVRGNTNHCWEKMNKELETQVSSCYITTGPVMGIALLPIP